MSRVPLGMLLGLVIGAMDVLLMLPLSLRSSRILRWCVLRALCAWLLRRDRTPPSVTCRRRRRRRRALTSAPDAIITNAYAPIS